MPRKLAIEASKGNITQIEALKKKRAIREAKELEEAKIIQERIDGLVFEFEKKAGKTENSTDRLPPGNSGEDFRLWA